MRILIFILVLSAIPPYTGKAQTFDKLSPPILETRMWCSDDIENYFNEMKARELRFEDAMAWNSNWTGYWKKHNGKIAEVDNSWIDFTKTPIPDSVIMRNIAYGYLHNWPKSRALFHAWMQKSFGGQATHGESFLRWFYHTISTIKAKERGDISATTNSTVNNWYDDWEEVFGPDPEHLPEEITEGYVPEEFDCKWYLSVKMETEGLSYYALMVKKGHIFGPWNKSNTVVKSHLFSKNKTMQSLYPVEFFFFLGDLPTDQAIKFTDPLFYPTWVDIEPRPYSGPDGDSPHIVYDFEYKLWDPAQNIFLPAKATLSSAPGEHFKEVERLIDNLESFNLDSLGKDFRFEAGEYKMPD